MSRSSVLQCNGVTACSESIIIAVSVSPGRSPSLLSAVQVSTSASFQTLTPVFLCLPSPLLGGCLVTEPRAGRHVSNLSYCGNQRAPRDKEIRSQVRLRRDYSLSLHR